MNPKFSHRIDTTLFRVILFTGFFLNLAGLGWGQVTKTWVPTNGGAWTTAGNWNPSGVPGTSDHVLIPNNQTNAITAVGTSNGQVVSISGLTISGNCNFQSDAGTANSSTLNITQTFTVNAGKTFTVGLNNAGRLNLTLASTATGTINGTVYMNSFSGSGYDRTFTNSGDLTISGSGLITGQNTSIFVLSSGATLRIANTAGITTSGATGAIQVPGIRTYSAAANYVYNGTAAQNTGNGYPSALTGSLTIDNSNGVTIVNAARTITTGTLNLVQGPFATNNGGDRLSLGSTATINRSGGSMTGTLQGTGAYDVNYTGNSKNTGPELLNAGLRNVTVNLEAGQTLTSNSNAFSVTNNLTVTNGNLVLKATDADYSVSNDLTVGVNGTLTHSVNWDDTGKLLRVNGNITIDGSFAYTVRSHVQMGGANKTIRTGPAPSSLSILTLVHTSGTITASGLVTVDDNFWASFNTAGGTFATSSYTIYAKAALLNAGGTININGGTLNVTGGLLVGTSSNNGTVTMSSGTLNVDNINVGDGTRTGTFTQSGGTANISGNLMIYPLCSYTCSNSPAINIGGNWTNNGTFTRATGTVTFNGTGPQSIGGNTAPAFYNLTFSNNGGAISFGAACGISNIFSITAGPGANLGSFTHTAKTLTLGGFGTPAGSWGSTSSPAIHQNDTYFEPTTGIVNVSTGSCGTITFNASLGNNVSCYGGNDGKINIHLASADNSPYTFSINNGVNYNTTYTGSHPNFTLTGLSAGANNIRIKDANGCLSASCP